MTEQTNQSENNQATMKRKKIFQNLTRQLIKIKLTLTSQNRAFLRVPHRTSDGKIFLNRI